MTYLIYTSNKKYWYELVVLAVLICKKSHIENNLCLLWDERNVLFLQVTIIGDGSQTPVTVAGDKLTNADDLRAKGSEIPMPGAISASRGTLGDKLFG